MTSVLSLTGAAARIPQLKSAPVSDKTGGFTQRSRSIRFIGLVVSPAALRYAGRARGLCVLGFFCRAVFSPCSLPLSSMAGEFIFGFAVDKRARKGRGR